MKRFAYILAAGLVAAAFTTGAFAAATAGILRSNGGVSVNGSPVTPVTTVFAGDRIETAPQAGGNISVGSSSLSLTGNSSLLFQGQNLDFQCGGGIVQTSDGLTSRYGHTLVKPAKESARYRVQQTGVSLQITALDGDLSLAEGAREFNLPAGKSVTVAYNGCAADVAKTDLPNAGTNATSSAPQEPPIATGGIPPSLSTASVVTPIVTITAVSITGYIVVHQNPVSPSHP